MVKPKCPAHLGCSRVSKKPIKGWQTRHRFYWKPSGEAAESQKGTAGLLKWHYTPTLRYLNAALDCSKQYSLIEAGTFCGWWRKVMLFINSFTANAGTLSKRQKHTPRQDPVRCPYLPSHWHQEAPQPPLPSTPAPIEIQMPVLEGTAASPKMLCMADWRSRTSGLSWCLPKKKGHAGCSWSRSVSGLVTMLPSPAATVTQESLCIALCC